MKPVLTGLILICSHILVSAQEKDKIILGRIESIPSKILNVQRKIWVYLPPGAIGEASEKQHLNK